MSGGTARTSVWGARLRWFREAALLAVASTPGLTGVLLSTNDPGHWKLDADVFDLPPVDPARLREICAVFQA